jgi:hypothetical protein
MAKKQVAKKQAGRKPTRKSQANSKAAPNKINGQPEVSPLEALLEKGKKSKALSQSEVLAALPDGGLDVEAADVLIAKLVEEGIEVLDVDEGDTEHLADVDEPDDAAL